MTLDPTFSYFLVGKTTAEILSHSQAGSLVGMQAVFSCLDFSGYAGAPTYTDPAYWQSAASAFPGGHANFNAAWMFGESGIHENELAELEVTTLYTTPSGAWADISETTGGAENNTGLFLVGVKGASASVFTAVTYGDYSGFTSPTDKSVGYAYSTTDGGQRIYVTTSSLPFFEPQVSQVLIYAAYDAPPIPPAFWTGFVGSHEAL